MSQVEPITNSEPTIGGEAAHSKGPLLSAIVVVRNEEANIGRCIRSLQGLCDEIVVLDTGSTDATVRIAQDLGARVFHEPWRDDFAYTNNIALGHATGEWVMLVDADEELLDTEIPSVRAWLQDHKETDILLVKILLAQLGGHVDEMHAMRVVRKSSGAKWAFPIHSQIIMSEDYNGPKMLNVGVSDITIRDYGYSVSQEINKQKALRNLRIVDAWLERLRSGTTLEGEPTICRDTLRHAQHTVLKTAWGLGDWKRCSDAALEILELNKEGAASSLVTDEAVVLGAASLLNLKKYKEAMSLIRHGQEASPLNPDIHYVATVVSIEWYMSVLDRGLGTSRPRDDLQLWVFRHNPVIVQGAHEMLTALPDGLEEEPA